MNIPALNNKIAIIVSDSDLEQGKTERIDSFLASRPNMPTRSLLKKLINNGQVALNGKPAKPSSMLTAGDRIEFELPPPSASKIAPEPIDLNIAYEDEYLIVIDKPAGLIVHPTSSLRSGTLVNALLYHCSDLSGIGGELKPGIVHRLDKLTSGLLVAAKTDQAHLGLAEQFKEHSIVRRYQALVHGKMASAQGTFSSLIARDPRRRKQMSGKVSKGKTAVTHYKVVACYEYFSLIECRLETGRTHQIRVHLSENNHPLVGDPVYNKGREIPPGVSPPQRAALRNLKRQALHAYVLGFVHPATGEPMEFRSELPEDMRVVISSLEGPCN